MAIWKVSREEIKLSIHSNSDNLELANLGGNQIVIKKGEFKDGDVVVFIPEKSILPDVIADQFRPYLIGNEHNRVKGIRLRGEPSCGIVIPDKEELKQYEIGQDISEVLGITKFEPQIPAQLRGKIDQLNNILKPSPHPTNPYQDSISKHDVESFGIYASEFQENEEVQVTEKIHGSQITIVKTSTCDRIVSSKGLISRGHVLKDEESNSYWTGTRNTKIFELLQKYYPDKMVQAFGELVPVQKGFTYGFTQPWILLFDIRINCISIPFDEIPEELKALWVPVLYRGPYNIDVINTFKVGMETVSGRQLHIKEGVVLRPSPDRFSSDKNPIRLMVKLLNPKYKEDDEAIA